MTDDTFPSPPPVAALVLAAGSSRRAGPVNKLLVDIDGRPMVAAVAATAAAAGLAPVLVVTGHDAAAVEAAVAGTGARCVHNPDHAEGMAASLRHGLSALAALAPGTAGALVCLGDMPWVQARTLEALAAAFRVAPAGAICRPRHGGRAGNPVLFAAAYFEALGRLTGDRGGKAVVERYADHVIDVNVDDAGIFRDLDVPPVR